MMRFGIIGGTGFYRATQEGPVEEIEVETKYGRATLARTTFGGEDAAFLARHGSGHSVPPHRVNYRANIMALKKAGVTNILATAAVGSLTEGLPPGSLALVTDFMDFTRGRPTTFYEGEEGEVVHVDVSEPYCRQLREELEKAAGELGEELARSAVYVCVEGPRFETKAEIRMFRQLGGEVVGMTNVPEVTLAREAGICYATVAIVTNWGVGMTEERVEHEKVSALMEARAPKVRELFEHMVRNHIEIECECRRWRGK